MTQNIDGNEPKGDIDSGGAKRCNSIASGEARPDAEGAQPSAEKRCIESASAVAGSAVARVENSRAEGLRAPDGRSFRDHQSPGAPLIEEAPLPKGMACAPAAERPADRSSSTWVPTGESLDPAPCASRISTVEAPVGGDGSRQGHPRPNGCDDPIVGIVSVDAATSVLSLNGVGGDHANAACDPLTQSTTNADRKSVV